MLFGKLYALVSQEDLLTRLTTKPLLVKPQHGALTRSVPNQPRPAWERNIFIWSTEKKQQKQVSLIFLYRNCFKSAQWHSPSRLISLAHTSMKTFFGELKKDWMRNVPRETAPNAAQVVKEHFSQVYPLKHLNTISGSCNNLWVTWQTYKSSFSFLPQTQKMLSFNARNIKCLNEMWLSEMWKLAFHLPSIYSLVPANNIFCQVLNLLVLDIYNGIDFWEASSTWIQ